MFPANEYPRKFIVIGSNCFTGSHIVDALLDNPKCEVTGVSRSPERREIFLPYKRRKNPKFSFYQIDLVTQMDRLIRQIEQIKPDVIINVAALSEVELSKSQPLGYFETNTIAVVKLCDYLRTSKFLARYVHISTAEVYGTCETPLPESAPLNPSTPYAVSKAAADLYVATLHRNFGFPAILIRSTNVYGKHQQLYKIIPRAMLYLKMGRQIELHGGGTAIKSWVHIRDVASGIVCASKVGQPGVYHFSDSNRMSVAEVVRKICELMGSDFESSTTSTGDRLGQDAKYLLDYVKAGRELGWEPKVLFEDGLEEIIEWLEDNWNEIRTESLVYVHQS